MLAELNWRKIGFVAVCGLLILLAIMWLVNYLGYGKIIIESDNPNNTITLNSLEETGDGGGAPKKITTAKKTLSVKTRAGQYVVAVTGNSVATTQLVKVSPHKTVKYKINPINTTGVAPVAYVEAQNMVASANELLYLNSSTDYISKIDSANNIVNIGQHYPLNSVSWINTAYGVGQDRQGRLYSIDVGKNLVRPLDVPFNYSSSNPVSYDVSSDGQIYIASGSTIYSGRQGAEFKKIYSAESSQLKLSAGRDILLINENPGEGNPDKEARVTAIKKDGGRMGEVDFEANLSAWSPNGKYVVMAAETGASIMGGSLRTVSYVPSTMFISHLLWLDNDKLLYSSDDQLWVYSLQNKSAQLVANMPLGQGLADMTVSSDGSYVYVVTLDQNNKSVVRRIGLGGQEVPEYLYRLQDIMPIEVDAFSISMVGLKTPPKIIVKPYNAGSAVRETYPQTARQELSLRGFDTSSFSFDLAPPRPSLTAQ